MSHEILIAVLLLSPLVGFILNGVRFRSTNYLLAGSIATGAVVISFACAIALFTQLLGLQPDQRKLAVTFFEWMAVDKFKINMGFVVDQISSIMILIITGVGSLIHLFSIGYMHHDKGVTKYFAYLNLFLFNMLILVLGDSLLTMFVGWEGVGLCSYLLIGFWFNDSAKAAAGMKAFITNRVGDAAFIIGMFILFTTFGTLNLYELNALAPTTMEASWLGMVTLGTLMLFIGATGKSAQIPLYVWLPDAMAGPTPVSALIHAATMVTAGVYMIVRLNPLFVAAPNTMMVIAIVGAATAVMAATIGLTQTDIKKVLAYSTVSQLGYMFLAVGVGAFGAGMFHLMTHAFFKALMFLGSGSVIHAMHEEQDIRKMGGLRKYMPITHFTFFLGWLAIIGMPPFAGFFSKDEILYYAFSSPRGHILLWLAGAIGATLTAFYMTRLMALTFWGKSRVDKSVHPHESPLVMTIPLMVLGLLSVIGGWIGIPHVIGHYLGHLPNFWAEWLSPLIKTLPEAEGIVHSATEEWILMGVSVTLASVSALVAFIMYTRKTGAADKVATAIAPVYNVVNNKYYVDEAYFGGIINPLVNASRNLWQYVDVNVIDKATYKATDLVRGGGAIVKSLQNGNMQTYAMYVVIGVVIALSYMLMG
ncbi:NADH-quinone oxidoreductase subunit L [Pseudobdellovibrio exovorus]|uniref:NADH dehydrogenase I chain L n=1 Tax=Pseudobdellovibrio exovorus JSS TaxID=1184267 RepID=M4VC47_9BACT|nr:NADH-quinone oxidoreductase subunit L [Pseudobdellovibrio exovorus]AGH96813.1 NADH dehydrogenase I chain L [Pseudobdellovibrio exovorus JSS]